MSNELGGLENLVQQLGALEGALRDADVQDASAFCDLLARSIVLLNLQQKDIAEDFDTSQATVARWRQGTHVPYPAVRRLIYTGLRKRAGQHRRSVEARIDELRRIEAAQRAVSERRSGSGNHPAVTRVAAMMANQRDA